LWGKTSDINKYIFTGTYANAAKQAKIKAQELGFRIITVGTLRLEHENSQ
jgi:hypothetical protein